MKNLKRLAASPKDAVRPQAGRGLMRPGGGKRECRS